MQQQDNFIISENQREHIVTYADGTKRTARLFYSQGGLLCEFRKGSRRYGFLFDGTNVVKVEPKVKNDVDGVAKARRFLKKVIATLEKSGLWSNILHDFRILSRLDDEKLKKYLNCDWDENVEMSKELGLVCGRMCGVDNLKWTIEKGIKSINYRSWEKDELSARFASSIANKETWNSLRWEKGYDNSVACKYDENNNVMRAWYSEEFRNCGNGWYYLAIDEKHAIFCEKD